MAIAISAFLSIPLLLIKDLIPALKPMLTVGTVFFSNFIILAIAYFIATREYFKNKNIFQFFKMFQVYLSFAVGMSFHNSIAVLQGYFGKRTPFIRTPKFNNESNASLALQRFGASKISGSFIVYVLLFLLFFTAAAYGIFYKNYGFLLFHLTLTFGMALLLIFDLKESLTGR